MGLFFENLTVHCFVFHKRMNKYTGEGEQYAKHIYMLSRQNTEYYSKAKPVQRKFHRQSELNIK